MLKRQYLGYMIFGLGLIFLTAVLLSKAESVNSQSKLHSIEWIKPLAQAVFCGDDCPSDFAAKPAPTSELFPESNFAGESDNQTCIECHGDGIATDVDFLVSPQEMTHQLKARFLTVSKRVFALQPAQNTTQYQAMMDSYMQIHHQQVLGNSPISDPAEVGSALRLLTTVENLVNEVEGQNHWAEIKAFPFTAMHEAVPPLKYDKKCGIGGICQQFIQSIKPPASSPEKHVSDTPVAPIEIRWSISRRGPPAFSTLISSNTRRLQPYFNGRSPFLLNLSVIIPIHRLAQRPNLVKEQIIEQIVVNEVKEVGHFRLHVTASKHLEKSLR